MSLGDMCALHPPAHAARWTVSEPVLVARSISLYLRVVGKKISPKSFPRLVGSGIWKQGNASRALTGMTAAMTQQLHKFSTDTTALPDLAAKLSAGATSGLGPVVKAFNLGSSDQSDLVAATTAGPTQGLATLATKVPALASSANLSAMLEKITAAPAAILSKAGFTSTQVPTLLGSLAYGASSTLGSLTQINVLNSSDASSFLKKISLSVNTSAASVNVPNFTANSQSIETISTTVSQKSTAALSRIAAVDPHFGSSEAQNAINEIASGAVSALGNLAKAGKILSSDIGTLAGKASGGALSALSGVNVPGLASVSVSAIANQINSAQSSAMTGISSLIQGFDPTAASSSAQQVTGQATSGVTIPQYDLNAAKTQCTNMHGTWDTEHNRCILTTMTSSTTTVVK